MRRLVAPAAVGLVGGGLFALSPMEWLDLELAAAAAWAVAWLAAWAVRRRPSPRWLSALPVAAVVAIAAIGAPLKGEDQRIRAALPAETLSVEALAQAVGADAEGLSDEERGRLVRLPALQPTWRALDEVLARDAALSLRFQHCGNGASLLFGPHPIGTPRLVRRKE